MRDWYVGQKIVCVNAQPIDGLRNRFVDEYNGEGKVYKIRQILVFGFLSSDKLDERLASGWKASSPIWIKGANTLSSMADFDRWSRATKTKTSASRYFLTISARSNSGLVRFQDEDMPELERIDPREDEGRAPCQLLAMPPCRDRLRPTRNDPCAQLSLMKASRSALITSAWVVGIPWGRPG